MYIVLGKKSDLISTVGITYAVWKKISKIMNSDLLVRMEKISEAH